MTSITEYAVILGCTNPWSKQIFGSDERERCNAQRHNHASHRFSTHVGWPRASHRAASYAQLELEAQSLGLVCSCLF
jgi:hypothetical protein